MNWNRYKEIIMKSNKSKKNRYKRISKEFDLCELEIAQTINNYLSQASWKELAYSKKFLYQELARKILNVTEKYYELTPTFWIESI
jgi:hypothetical protein